MVLIDSHSHLYLEEFKEDRPEMMERAQKAGVDKIFLPNIDSNTVEDMLQLEADFPGRVFAMMGLHPCSVNENVERELTLVRDWLSKRNFAAVGEIGLDFYRDITYKQQQIEAFSHQIDWALEYDLPIVIHSRNSTRECIDIIRSKQAGNLRGVFHCFSGTLAEAIEIIGLGFYLGIGGVLTFKKSTLPAIIKEIELRRLVLETDSPYLAPVPFRGKRNESSYVKAVAEKLAEIKSVSLDEVATVTTENALQLFSK